jgi:hypothetical protein
MLTIYYNGYPCPTNFDNTNGNVYKTDIRVRDEGRLSYVITVIRRFGGSDVKAIGWRCLDNGIEKEFPLGIKNKLELK